MSLRFPSRQRSLLRSPQMRWVSLLAASVCAAIMLCALPAHAAKFGKLTKENKRADSREIERLEDEWRQALLTSDSVMLEKLLADDFLGISANGTLSDKQQYLRRIGGREHIFSTMDQLTLKVRMQGSSAIVVSEARVTGQLDGSPIAGVYRYTRVYGRKPGGPWKVVNFEATRVSGEVESKKEMHGGTPVQH